MAMRLDRWSDLRTGAFGKLFSAACSLAGKRDADEGSKLQTPRRHSFEARCGGNPGGRIPSEGSQATYFNWKRKYEGLTPPEMRRLKHLEDENTELSKLVVDLSLDREMLQQ